ncbi:hypothetical protein [Bacillus sp. MUM 13]|uniref:hypothetical protein n=1 Tax=Bacillus sp. MUM 13 TaxID=1678001 RepID=UPI0008F58501|nr:hypothetical protein [Bacillus sp. MUM 13]OIK07156.1 hypothetical protein BIV59_21230 [Bacillus sp. MUM 13]
MIKYLDVRIKTNKEDKGNVLSGNYQLGNVSVPKVFDYKGIKYSPVNLIGDLLGEKALFNKSADTVYFGTQPKGSYMSDILPPYKKIIL